MTVNPSLKLSMLSPKTNKIVVPVVNNDIKSVIVNESLKIKFNPTIILVLSLGKNASPKEGWLLKPAR